VDQAQSFGAQLRLHRLAAGLSQEALAESAGLSVRGISDLERGVRNAPHPGTLARLADALGLDATARMLLSRASKPAEVAPEPDASGQSVPYRRLAQPLPIPLTSFVGRQRELADVWRQLEGARLLTLVGPGGVGKTRFALEVARVSEARSPGSVSFVELAPLAEPGALPTTVATSLGVADHPGRAPLDTLAQAIGTRIALLVLDNCEHVVAASAELADGLLRACDGLTVLATSREPLGIAGEVLWRVPSLAVPARGARLSDGQLPEVESVRLFVERAQSALPSFTLTEANASAVAEVCRRLDGIPLAVELAAARVRAVPVTTIAARLNDRFRLLIGGSRTALPRHRTLAATLDWSYQLLGPLEQALLRRLAVFAGGWTLDAAEAVSSWSPLGPDEVLDRLAALVDRSLVQVDLDADAGQGRYHLLETVRQYAAERLREADESAVARDRHLEWAITWAELAVPRLVGQEQVFWLRRISLEHDNFRAALEWSRDQANGEAELRLAASLGRFWHLSGASTEARVWLRHALDNSSETASFVRALALNWAGRFATVNGEADDRRLLEQSVAMAEEIGDSGLHAIALRHLSMATKRVGDEPATRVAIEAALGAARRAGDRREEAFALVSLGATAEQAGDTTAAATLLAEGLAMAQEVGDAGPIGWALTALGAVALREGRFERAEELLAEALAVARPMGYWAVVVSALAQLGALARARGELADARDRGRECLAQAQAAGDMGLVAAALSFVADLEVHAGNYELGTRLLAAEGAWRAGLDARRAVSFWTWPAPTPDAARANLGEAAFARVWAEGQQLPLEAAIAEVLAQPPRAG
jgi:predicted ATPase/DNA-binding XRE family transcriptional regulator